MYMLREIRRKNKKRGGKRGEEKQRGAQEDIKAKKEERYKDRKMQSGKPVK